MTTAEKNDENKSNMDKAKSILSRVAGIIKGAAGIGKFLKGLLSGEASYHHDDVKIIINKDGSKEISGPCTDSSISIGATSGDPQNPTCAQIKGGNQLIRKNDGTYENQIRLDYEIYRECYYTKKCGVQYLTFVFGSVAEMNRTLNEILGENYFQ